MVDEKELIPFDLKHYPIVPLVGVGVLLIHNNSLLLVRRKFNPNTGYWSISGGY